MPNILLIEPDHILANQLSNYLKSVGHEVTPTSHAQEAILAADKLSPDIVIVEPLLTENSGVEFLYEFRSYDEWQKIPVIILSRISSSDLGITDKVADDLGVSVVAYKPDYSLKKISDQVEKILDQNQ